MNTIKFVLCTVATTVLLCWTVQPQHQTQWKKPVFPLPGKSYVSSYTSEEIDRYLFLFGIFGFGDRIRDSEILIYGSSHVQTGISAKVLSERLQARAFNLGLGYGEGISFVRDIIERNDLSRRMLIVDIYNPLGVEVSEPARKARKANVLDAYVETGKVWANFYLAWILDGAVTRLEIQDAGFAGRRYLRTTAIRSWNASDYVEIWTPTNGRAYSETPARLRTVYRPIPETNLSKDFSAAFSTLTGILEQRRIDPVFTLIPYPGYSAEDSEVRSLLRIAPEGLEYMGDDHLNINGRLTATARLADAMSPLSAIRTKRGR